jgi:hypothetical protein
VAPTAVVFVGPTLPVAEASRLVNATFLPPAGQGDVYRAVKRLRPDIIGIIDGYFHQTGSVWHREILWAMAEGIHVLGGASMGALRAAELQKYGMRGIGKVFEAYRDGRFAPFEEPFEDDDEVAVIHGPAEIGFVPLSEAMVDIRDTLARAAQEGVITRSTRDELAAAGKRLPYRERLLAHILQKLAAGKPASPELTALAAWLPSNRTSRKAQDAVLLLEEIGRLVADFPGWFAAGFRLEPASVWTRFLENEETTTRRISEIEARAIEELRLRPAEWRVAHRQALLRHVAVEQAVSSAVEPPSDREMRASLDRLRHSCALMTRQELAAWAERNGLDGPGLERLMHQEALLDRLQVQGSGFLESEAADHLRLNGRFAELAARSCAKRHWASEAGMLGRRPSGVAAAELMDWFIANRLGQRVMQRPKGEQLAAELGFRDFDAFLEALWLERTYSSEVERQAIECKAPRF